VAKEFIAAQDPEDPDVLTLSRFVGATAQMPDAVLVNPHDIQALYEGMQRALRMPLAERHARYQALVKGLRKQDLTWWRNTFPKALTEPLA